MAREEDDDLYDEEFDFVDDDDVDDEEDEAAENDASDLDDESDLDRGTDSDIEAADDRGRGRERGDVDADADIDDRPVDEYGRPAPKADYVVHVYEHNKFKRTIDRPFTPEDAEAFATEYNRTSKSYGRLAVTSKNDVKPKKTLA